MIVFSYVRMVVQAPDGSQAILSEIERRWLPIAFRAARDRGLRVLGVWRVTPKIRGEFGG